MLSYEKHKATVVPNTMQRFHFHLSKSEVVDGLTNSILKTKNGSWELPNTNYPSDLTMDELYLLVKKPMFINSEDFFKSFRTNRMRLIAKPNTNPARNTRFWKLNVECSYYPGFYYIPGYTNYVISENGQVISTITGCRLKFTNNSTGYPACRMNRDDGKSCYVLLHTLLGLTFKEWDWNIVNQVIDHLDTDKLNYRLNNLEWVSDKENKSRAHRVGLIPSKAKPIYCYDLQENKVYTFDSQTHASETLNVPKSSVQNHLSKLDENKLLHSRYFIEYREIGECGGFIGGFDFDNPESNRLANLMAYKVAEGSQPKPVLAKSLTTGEITKFPSVVNFIQYSGLTRKQVYPRLREKRQKVYGDIIFKYEDDDTEWIK